MTATSCYYNKDEIAWTDEVARGKACTSTEMKRKATYEGWDFETTWGRNNDVNDGYPFLRLFHPDVTDSSDVIMGDANGDGTVDVADVVAIVNQIHGQPDDSFVIEAADMNGDGKVNVADVVATVNVILGN
jgi:hypothetical protein